MFLHLSVSHSVHGGVADTPQADPHNRHTPWADIPQTDTPPPKRPLQRAVRILLERFLVVSLFNQVRAATE